MRKTRQVFRLKWKGGLSNRAIARACKIGRATVRDYLNRAEKAGLSWTQVEQMNEADLEDALFPKAAYKGKGKIIPDWSYIYQELKRKGVTLRLLWQERYQSDPQASSVIFTGHGQKNSLRLWLRATRVENYSF